MLGLATLAVELSAAEPGAWVVEPLAWSGLALAIAWLAWFGFRRIGRGSGAWLVRLLIVGLAVVFALPTIALPLHAQLFGHGLPFELRLLYGLRNVGLALLAIAGSRESIGCRADGALSRRGPACDQLAAIVSLFMVLFACTMADDGALGRLLFAAVAGYATVGSFWMLLGYWQETGRSVASSMRRRPPVAGFLLTLGALVLVLAAPIGARHALGVLTGFMPSSGGMDQFDPSARGGVNDGPNELSGNNPQSTGFVDSDIYLSTTKPSLYDAFNDLYGDPIISKRVERAIALRGNTDVRELDRNPAQNLEAGREFPTTRRSPRQQRWPSDRMARALLFVRGRTPLHLRLAAYDQFDGIVWHEAPKSSGSLDFEKEPGSAWMRVIGVAAKHDVFAGSVQATVKIGRLDTSAMPLPAHVRRFRVGAVDRADFFEAGQDDIPCMAGRTLPAGTAIECESRVVDPRRLLDIMLPSNSRAVYKRYLQLPSEWGPDLAESMSSRSPPGSLMSSLIESWTDGVPRGWRQVEAVVNGLRTYAANDRSARVPDDCSDTIGHFLATRSGPDYLFATAAAVMLRSLGYPTRTVSGFYVSPEHYDHRTRHTPVVEEDAHFWAEVQLPGGTWIAIEPTPGYELMGPDRSWRDHLVATAIWLGRWAWRNAVPLAVLVSSAIAAFWFRRELQDMLATAWWRIALGGSSRQRVMRTVRLIECRCRYAGQSRPRALSPARWYRRLAGSADPGARSELESLITLLNWAAYAPMDLERPRCRLGSDVTDICCRAVRVWTLTRFRSTLQCGDSSSLSADFL
jgi:hypothetical protein